MRDASCNYKKALEFTAANPYQIEQLRMIQA